MQIYDVPVIYTLNMIIILCCWNSFSALAFWLGVIRSVQLLRCWQGYLSGWKFTAWFAYAVADTTAAASFLASLWCTVVFLSVTHTHTHLFNGPFSRTTQVSRYQKGKTNLDFTEAKDCEWQWHQLGHMQVCISLQTDNHATTPPLKFFYRPDALPATQPTVSKHWRQCLLPVCYWFN